MNANDIKIRCSALGKIMTEPQGGGSGLTEIQAARLGELTAKKFEGITSKQEEELQRLIAKRDAPPELSETCKKYLAELWVKIKYGREKDISNRYTTKGLLVEEDSLTLHSDYKDQLFVKNNYTYSNDYIQGTPDVIIRDLVNDNLEVLDIKSSWDIFTFFAVGVSVINKLYFYQLQGYMALTGAKKARLAYCLIDTPDALVNDEKRRLQWKMTVIDDSDPAYVEAAAALDHNMKYGDIPIEERVIEIEVARDDKAIAAIYERVKLCRAHIEKTYFSKLTPATI